MKLYPKDETKRMLCRYHNLDGAEALCGKKGVEKIMQRIHSIQYDPLNVVARNADLVLQARVKDFSESVLYDLLYKEHKLIDGFDKEMCIYDTKDFARFQFVRNEYEKYALPTLKYRNQTGVLNILDDVRDFVEKHGKTGTKDISIGEVRESRWGHKKLSSAALDYLYNTGVLTVTDKRGTQKYFDLTERVIGSEEIQIEGIKEPFYISKKYKKYMKNRAANSYVRFIAPLDNIMWDKQMLEMMFGFTYRWEVHTPVKKRKYGYYVLPVLYNGQFIARFEAEPIRKAEEFIIKNWWWEPKVEANDEMGEMIVNEIARFTEFLQIDNSPKNTIKLGV